MMVKKTAKFYSKGMTLQMISSDSCYSKSVQKQSLILVDGCALHVCMTSISSHKNPIKSIPLLYLF